MASISQPFCGDCNRLRVTAEGMAYTCLLLSKAMICAHSSHTDSSTDELQKALKAIWQQRTDRYSEEREQRQGEIRQPAEMAYLGG